MSQRRVIEQMIAPIVSGLGLECVGMQYLPQGRSSVLRLFVDKESGASIEDCTKVSRQVNAVLNVENPLPGQYLLEVSTPGFDRILFSLQQCEKQVGKLVSVRLVAPMAGRKNFKGRLESVSGANLSIRMSEEEATFAFGEIDEIRLVPEWGGLTNGSK